MLDRPIKRQYAIMKKLEEEMGRVMDSIQLPKLTWDKLSQYLNIHYPEHADSLESPPFWISALFNHDKEEEETNGEWTTAGKKKEKIDDEVSRTLYGFWRKARDLAFVSPPLETSKKGKKKQKQEQDNSPLGVSVDPAVTAFFASLGFGTQLPPVPTTTRRIEVLLDSSNVWSMSVDERNRLAAEWEQRMRQLAYTSNLQHYEQLRSDYKEACKEYNDARDEVRGVSGCQSCGRLT